jgi:RNA polymerase sigma factor (sigma-70 family)
LLERFANHRDEAAFEALVRRHGPMVLGVCRRVLAHAQDMEDAFQTTFLVLVRRAGSVERPELLGNWLYGVAYRTALKAKANAARRRDHERRAACMPREEPDPTWREVRTVLDEELNQLPDKYRAPLVLCYLEGRTNQEAARLLGWPTGSMSGRLAAGRELLRKRLERRGHPLAEGMLAFHLGHNMVAGTLPTSLVTTTVKAAVLFAAGKAVAGSALSASVAALTEEMLQALGVTLVRRSVIISVVLGLLVGFGALALAGHSFSTGGPADGTRDQPPPATSPGNEPAPRPASGGACHGG